MPQAVNQNINKLCFNQSQQLWEGLGVRYDMGVDMGEQWTELTEMQVNAFICTQEKQIIPP